MTEREKGTTGSGLKCIAMLTMFVDHAAVCLLTGTVLAKAEPGRFSDLSLHRLQSLYFVLRMIGRLAFPIFAFLLVEGFLHTHSRKKYGIRLFVFALLSEIPFDLALFGKVFYLSAQNTIFTLFLGFLAMLAVEKLLSSHPQLCLLTVLGIGAASWLFRTDYQVIGVFAILLLYWFRDRRKQQMMAGAAAFLWEPAALFAFLFLYFYNGKRGRLNRFVGYGFYPLHLLLLYGISRLIIIPRL